MQFIDKPGSVVDDHLSRYTIAGILKRVAMSRRIAAVCSSPCSRQGLPPPHVTMRRCELLPRDLMRAVYTAATWSLPLTRSLLSPLPRTFFANYLFAKKVRGGIVSVALSLGSPPAVANGCRILCCPDFPLAPKRKRSSNELLSVLYQILVGMTGLEPAASRPPAVRATNCATSRCVKT